MDPEEGGNEPQNAPQGKVFTEEEVNALLSRERDKLHGRLDKSKTQQDAMKQQLAELQAAEQARAAAEEQARKEAEEAQRKAAEAEMSAKELIDKRTRELQESYEKQQNEWANRYSTLENQLAEREAVFAKEREFQELARYAQDQVNAHSEEIAPELVRYIGKNCTTREEIDASVAEAIEATSSILAGIQNAQQQQRAQMPGVSTGGFTPTGPMDGAQGGTKTFTAEEIKAMSAAEYAQYREQFGVTGNNVGSGKMGHLGRGLFG